MRFARLLSFAVLLWCIAAMVGVTLGNVMHAYRWDYAPDMTQLIIGVGVVCMLVIVLVGLFMVSRPDEYTGRRERGRKPDPDSRDPKTGQYQWLLEKRGGRHRAYEDEQTRVMRRGGQVRSVALDHTGLRE